MMKLLNNLLSKKSPQYVFPKEVQIKGDIFSSISGHIDGNVEGNVKTEGDLVISENAIITGDVSAHDLLLRGKIIGNIYCLGKIIFVNGCYLKGNATAAILDVQEGAVVEGIIKKTTAVDTPVVIPEILTDAETRPDLKLNQPSENQSSENWF